MPYHILELMDTTEVEIAEAAGPDRVAIVQGRRTRRQGSMDDEPYDDRSWPMTSGEKPTCHGGFIASGGAKRRRRPIVTYTNTQMQTDEPKGYFIPIPESFFEENEGILTARPRDIQLDRPVYLEEATKLGAGFVDNQLTQTVAKPDLGPLRSALEHLDRKSKNRVPRVKLNLWAPDKKRLAKPERGSEWLKVPASESDTDEEVKKRQYESQAKDENPADLDRYCGRLMKAINLLLLVLKVGGAWPLTTVVTKKWTRFQLQRFTWNYMLFAFMSLFHFCVTALSLYNTFIFIFTSGSVAGKVTKTSYNQVERLEFDKYWHYVFWTQITALYVCYWNVALLVEDSLHVKGLLTRWSYAVTQMHYLPIVDIRRRIILSTVGFGIYASLFTVLCFTQAVPAVSGSAGVIGALFFEKTFPKIRFSRHFYLVRLFGLLFHLYTVFAAKFSMLLIVTCSKIVENAAKNWNLRFAIRFRMLAMREGKEKRRIVAYRTDIPMSKLLWEHRLITSFSRQTSQVFHAALNVYLFTKGMEIVLFIYRSLAFLLIPDTVRFNATYIERVGDSGDRIRYKDTEAQRFLSCFVVLGFVLIGWFINSVNIAQCGEAIFKGFKYVSRYGLIICKNARERKFILSLDFEFAPVLQYSMKACYMFNRRYIFAMFLWIFMFSIGLLSFVPFNLQKETISFCDIGIDGEVSCRSISYSRSQRRAGAKPPISYLAPGPRKTRDFLLNYTCDGTTALDENGDEVPTEVLTLLACDKHGDRIPPFNRLNLAKCFDEFGNSVSDVPDATNSAPYQNHKNLFDCRTLKPFDVNDRDDCGNLKFGPNTVKVPQKLYFRDPNDMAAKVEAGFVCCFQYKGISGEEKSLVPCHGQSPTQIYYACHGNAKDQIDKLSCYTPEEPDVAPTTTDATITPIPECRTDWNVWGVAVPPRTNILTTEFKACDSDRNPLKPYGDSYCIDRANPKAPFPGPNGDKELFDCATGTRLLRDSCGNPAQPQSDTDTTQQQRPKKGLILYLNDNELQVMCLSACFNYPQFEPKNTASLEQCHMQSTRHAIEACKNRPGVIVSKILHRAEYDDADLVESMKCPVLVPLDKVYGCPVERDFLALQGLPNPSYHVTYIAACIPKSQITVPPFLVDGSQSNCFQRRRDGSVTRNDAAPYFFADSENLEVHLDNCIDTIKLTTDHPLMERDTCGNLAHAVAGLVKQVPVALTISAAIGKVVVCCFDYYFMPGNAESLLFCHMSSSAQAQAACVRYMDIPADNNISEMCKNRNE